MTPRRPVEGRAGDAGEGGIGRPSSDRQRPATFLAPLSTAGVDACAEIWQAAWEDGHRGRVPAELMAARDAHHFRCYLQQHRSDTTVCISEDGHIVGLVISDMNTGEVVQLAVAAAARGTGIADVLLGSAEARLAARHKEAWLAVVPANSRARALYVRRGWRDGGDCTYRAPAGCFEVLVPVRRYVKRFDEHSP